MIVVKVCDQQVIDAINTGFVCRGEDARGIAAAAPTVSGIDQQRLPGRRDDEGGSSALDIDEEDLERPRAERGARQHGNQQNRQE